jgi:hypothetical protein
MVNKNSIPGLMTLVGFSVAILFVVLGLYVIFAERMKGIPAEFRNIFGVVVIGYGLLRAVIHFQKYQQGKMSDDEEE